MTEPEIPDELTPLEKWSNMLAIRTDGLRESLRELCRNLQTPRYPNSKLNTIAHLQFMRRLLRDGLQNVNDAICYLSGDTKP